MKKTLTICALLTLVAGEALGCPYCTYQRVMPTWMVFAGLRVFAVCIIAEAVLDKVRILGVFIVYELIYYYLWRLAVWYSHPVVAEGVIMWLATALLLVLVAGVPAVLVLKFIGRFEWFRRKPDRGVSWKRALLIIPAMLPVVVAAGIITSG